MACRAGNYELLELLLREGTPWSQVVKRAFSSHERVVGEVWREMDLPQRGQSCGQAALMSANLELIKLIESSVGKEIFWENCCFVLDADSELCTHIEAVSRRFDSWRLVCRPEHAKTAVPKEDA